MSVRVGDSVFIRSGLPATVKERDSNSGQLKLESDLDKVQEETRHGYINGLSPDNRGRFNELLDAVKEATDDPAGRVEDLLGRLTELDKDPRNHQLSRYVRAEMVHIMNTHAIKPREYAVSESKTR